MKKVLLSLLAVCFAFAANAQEVCGYKAKAYQGTWTGLTGATLVNTEGIDMTLSYPAKTYNEVCYGLDATTDKVVKGTALENVKGFPIGFEFEYLGKKFTQFGICANGYVCLGAEGELMTFESSSSYWFKTNYSGKVFAKYAIGLYTNYRLSQVIDHSSALEDKDAFEILYKTIGEEGSKELVVEFKDAVMASSASLDNSKIYDETKCTVWSSQLHLCQNGAIYWVVKGLSEEGTSTNRGATTFALNDDNGNYVSLTNYDSGTDFLNNIVVAANENSTKKPQAATPDGWTIEFLAPEPTVTPTAQATLTYTTYANYKGLTVTPKAECADADNVLVVRCDEAEVSCTPVDGVTYATGDVIGNCVVVANNSAATLFDTPSIFKAFAYNSLGKGGAKYNTTDAPEFKITGFDSSLEVPTINVKETTENSITVNVTPNAQGSQVYLAFTEKSNWDSYTQRGVVGEITADMTAGTVLKDAEGNDCGKLIYVGAGNEDVKVEGLESGQYYYFVALNKDSKGNLTVNTHDWAGAAYAYTNYTLPVEYDLTNAARNSVPFGWTATATEYEEVQNSFYLPINNSIASQKASGPTDKSIPLIQCTNRGGGGGTYTLTSPEFTLDGNYVFSCDWKTIAWARFGTPPPYDPAMSWDEGDYVKFQVVVDGVATDLVSYDYDNAPSALNTADQWAKEKFDLSAYAGKNVKLQVVWNIAATTEVYFGLENIAIVKPNTLLTAGDYKITAKINPLAGVTVPDELAKYANGYTAYGELVGDAVLTISTSEEGFALNGFKVSGDAVVLSPANTLTFGDKEFNLGNAEGNTTGVLALTDNGDGTYTLAEGTVIYRGSVVGTVTGITITPITFGELPEVPANATYSWKAVKNTFEEVGGTATVEGDAYGTQVGSLQTSVDGVTYNSIKVADKKDFLNPVVISLNQAVGANDTIVIVAFKMKGNESKLATPMFKFFDGTTDMGSVTDTNDIFPDFLIAGKSTPAEAKYIVPAAADGATTIKVSRNKKDTNLFIAEIYILPYDEATGINEVNAKAVKSGKFLENGKLVIVKNGAKFNVAGIIE